MPILTTDLLFKLSVTTGAAGNTTAGTPNGSLGRYISTTQLSATPLNNLFDDVTGDENAASESEYRCVFFHNAHASITAIDVRVWISAEVAGGAVIALALDNIAASAIGASAAQAAQIANEDTAPTGVGAFSAPTTKGAAIVLGDIPAGSCRAFWVRRTTANTAAVNNDGVTLRVECDTTA